MFHLVDARNGVERSSNSLRQNVGYQSPLYLCFSASENFGVIALKIPWMITVPLIPSNEALRMSQGLDVSSQVEEARSSQVP